MRPREDQARPEKERKGAGVKSSAHDATNFHLIHLQRPPTRDRPFVMGHYGEMHLFRRRLTLSRRDRSKSGIQMCREGK